MSDYNKAKIYKITCNTTGKTYIGSTCKEKIKHRLAIHVSHYKMYLRNEYHYITSFECLKNDNYNIEILEEVKNCKTKDDLKKSEGYWIENSNCVNKCISGRSQKDSKRAYYIKNADIIRTKANTKYLCKCGGKYTHSNKMKHYGTNKHKTINII